MTPHTRMTIDFYLREAGLRTERPPSPATGATPFDDHLRAAASDPPSTSGRRPKGATLADYREQRVVSAVSAFHQRVTRIHDALPIGRRASQAYSMTPYADGPTATPADHGDHAAAAEPAVPPEVDASAGDDTLLRRSIRRAARRYDLSEVLIHSVIRTESNFRADAVSPAGAQGLMQLMPATAREPGVTDPFDVQQNIDGGAKYLRQMLDRFGGDLKLALAAYNAGPGTVARYDGRVPYRETREYVKRVLAGMDAASRAEA